jgi:hypothetical protein
MDIQEKINLAIRARFQQNEVEFAFPTYTIAFQNFGNDQRKVPSHDFNGRQ